MDSLVFKVDNGKTRRLIKMAHDHPAFGFPGVVPYFFFKTIKSVTITPPPPLPSYKLGAPLITKVYPDSSEKQKGVTLWWFLKSIPAP